MKTLATQMTSVTNSFAKTGLLQFLSENHNALLEWTQNFDNRNETFLCRKNSEAQLEAAYHHISPAQKQFQIEEIVQGWLVFYLSKLLLVNHREIDIHLPFEYYGITSLEALRFTHAIEVWLDRRFPVDLVYEYCTVQVLAKHLAQEVECVRPHY